MDQPGGLFAQPKLNHLLKLNMTTFKNPKCLHRGYHFQFTKKQYCLLNNASLYNLIYVIEGKMGYIIKLFSHQFDMSKPDKSVL